MLATEDPDIVIGTESWLNDSIATGEVFPNSYNVFRRDREASKGGGVFIAVKNTFIVTSEPNLITNCESTWILLHVKGLSPVYIGAFYRPQSTDRDYLLHLDLSLSKIPKNAAVWLLGDFNLPSVDWDTMSFKTGGSYPAISNLMIDIANDFNLHQIVKEPTRESNILDLCFTNSPARVDSVHVDSGISDHDVVIVNALFKPKVFRPPKRKVFLYHKANFSNIDDDMEELNSKLTPKLISSSSMDELYELFMTTLFNSIDKNIPAKLSSSRFSYPWVNRLIKRDIRRKQRLYNKVKKYGQSSHKFEFRKLRRSIDRKIRMSHNSYVRDIIGGSLKSDNTKPFWNFIKSKRTDTSGISPLQVHGRLLSTSKDKAKALNNQFCSVFTKEDLNSMPVIDSSPIPVIGDIKISTTGVLKLLTDLKVHKAAGPDNVTARVLKSCAHSIAPIFQKLFQKSVSSGCLPAAWLDANITPIYKKGERSDPANYRPVSLTSIPCKLLEHIIHRHIMDHFDKFNVLADVQHGFRKGRSCETQLSALVDDIMKILDNRSQADLIIMDFSKAFDTVPHQRLLNKLKHVGIRNNILNWIEKFLTNRYQRVLIDGTSSDKSKVISGVPQGTVLGPLLFLVYINDLPANIQSSVRLFADDCVLYRETKKHRGHKNSST
ncbi:RNA-directed DNA polymerase from mobile element jockey [Holothuria leucospilota]|uniref:RNA-directed DNA polymerase from mobile element jockey n=1 Tax=Holothuria leucospilota TaxID=206669 RepID=A0A9Q0YHT6_HOLLE|nr:RNA-directed DNA polymerase from mobile element jockey [Holothuria leucospilota]